MKASPHDFGARDDEMIQRISAACSGVEPEAARIETRPPGLRRSVASAYPGPRRVEPGVCCLIDSAKAAKHGVWSSAAPRCSVADESKPDNESMNTPRTMREGFIQIAPYVNFSKQIYFFLCLGRSPLRQGQHAGLAILGAESEPRAFRVPGERADPGAIRVLRRMAD